MKAIGDDVEADMEKKAAESNGNIFLFYEIYTYMYPLQLIWSKLV